MTHLSSGVYNSLDDKISSHQWDSHHGDQQRGMLGMSKNQGGARTYSDEKSYTPLNSSVRTKRGFIMEKTQTQKEEPLKEKHAEKVEPSSLLEKPVTSKVGSKEPKDPTKPQKKTDHQRRANPEKAKGVMSMPSPSNLKQMKSLSGKLTALNRFLSKSAERHPMFSTLKKCDDPICKKVPNLETAPDSKEVPESAKAREEPANMDLIDEVEVWKLYTNGASNDHGFEAGLILID
nr:reverse transcriptase domain-containing protein [Tanacetum cinerariifolium]